MEYSRHLGLWCWRGNKSETKRQSRGLWDKGELSQATSDKGRPCPGPPCQERADDTQRVGTFWLTETEPGVSLGQMTSKEFRLNFAGSWEPSGFLSREDSCSVVLPLSEMTCLILGLFTVCLPMAPASSPKLSSMGGGPCTYCCV